jgi:hypothetical protein
MIERRAECSCGQLAIAVSGDPIRVSICHCLACQLRTGSAFGFQARFLRSNAQIAGRSNVYVRKGDSGSDIAFHFCPDCGATVYWQLENHPDFIAIAVGAFADPNFPHPKFSVYESRRHGWLENLGNIEHQD